MTMVDDEGGAIGGMLGRGIGTTRRNPVRKNVHVNSSIWNLIQHIPLTAEGSPNFLSEVLMPFHGNYEVFANRHSSQLFTPFRFQLNVPPNVTFNYHRGTHTTHHNQNTPVWRPWCWEADLSTYMITTLALQHCKSLVSLFFFLWRIVCSGLFPFQINLKV
jgi:hypothetical protein